jgi:hypothetical protein
MKKIYIIVGIVTIIVAICYIAREVNQKESYKPHVGYPNTNDSIYDTQPKFESLYDKGFADECIRSIGTDAPVEVTNRCKREKSSFITSVQKLRDTAAFSPSGYYYGAFGYPEVYANIVYPYYYDWPYDVRGNFIDPSTTCEDVGRETKCYPSHPIKVSTRRAAPGLDTDLIPNNGTGYNAWKCCRDRILG